MAADEKQDHYTGPCKLCGSPKNWGSCSESHDAIVELRALVDALRDDMKFVCDALEHHKLVKRRP